MAERLKPKLSRIGEPLGKALSFRFQQQVISVHQGADHIAAHGNFCTGQVALGGMVNVHTGHGQTAAGSKMVGSWLYAVGTLFPVKIKVLG